MRCSTLLEGTASDQHRAAVLPVDTGRFSQGAVPRGLIQVVEMTEAVPGFVRAGRPRSQEAIIVRAGRPRSQAGPSSHETWPSWQPAASTEAIQVDRGCARICAILQKHSGAAVH